MKITVLKNPINVKISLSKNRIFETDISKELDIDTKNLREEILTQPAKYAWWSVLSDLAEKKVKIATEHLLSDKQNTNYPQIVSQYIEACKQYDLLSCTKEAFCHRKVALLKLWDKQEQNKVSQEYEYNLLNLKALSA